MSERADSLIHAEAVPPRGEAHSPLCHVVQLLLRAIGISVKALRVIPVDLVTRLAEHLDDHEAVVLLDDPLDLRLHVIRNDHEPVSLGQDRLVDPRAQLDLLET